MGDYRCHLNRNRHQTGRLKLAALVVGLLMIGMVATSAGAQQSAQGVTPVSPSPDAASAPAATEPAPDPTAASQMGMMPTIPAPNNQADAQAYQDVYVDGEKHSWRPLERGTQQAWEAYRNGDYVAAVPTFARLAKLGHPVAEWLMGNVYFAGQGVPQDYRQALIWFEKAADQGYMPAYAPTAKLYEQGKGTPIDLGKAYVWYNVAIAVLPYSIERYGLMKQRDTIAQAMTQAQIEAAQKRSVAFQPHKVIPPDIEQARKLLGE
jgi:hypothetical protein